MKARSEERIALKYPPIKPVFFVGASAGGVQALSDLAAQLPEDFPSPLFFLLHRKRSSGQTRAVFADILQARSRLQVVVPRTGDLVRARHIYVPPRNFHLVVKDNRIALRRKPDNLPWRPSIDVLFKSGARDYGERAVAVLLTGGLDDGVEGLRETTFQGGITVAQSPEDAHDPALPLNALLQDHPSYVLPLSDMPALFCELAQHPCLPNQKQILERAALTAARKRRDVDA